MLLETALVCLAHNIFFESRGESVLGQYAVAQVTMRRAGWDARRVCDVVHKPHQFSWTSTQKRDPKQIDPDAYRAAKKIAGVVLSGRLRGWDFTHGATHYHAVHVRPYWSKVFKRTVQIGRHIFYKQP